MFLLWLISLIIVITINNEIRVSAGNNDQYPQVTCRTTQGLLRIEVYREWSPLGADRFLELVKDGFYTDIGFFRCVR